MTDPAPAPEVACGGTAADAADPDLRCVTPLAQEQSSSAPPAPLPGLLSELALARAGEVLQSRGPVAPLALAAVPSAGGVPAAQANGGVVQGSRARTPGWADEPLPGYTCAAPAAPPGGAPDTAAPFGGDAAVAAYADTLVKAWAAAWDTVVARVDPRRNPRDLARMAAIHDRITTTGLDEHYRSIMATMKRGTIQARRLAWMRGHRELLEFCLAPPRLHGNWPVGGFVKVAKHARDTTPIPERLRDPDSIRVARGVAEFLDKLGRRLQGRVTPRGDGRLFTASNYAGHSSGPGIMEQGLSVDVNLRIDPERGFFYVADALTFFQAVNDLAAEESARLPATPTRWCALYNDSQVGRIVNRKVGAPRVGWQLGFDLSDPANCHGPDPLKVHIHLELQTADSYAPAPAAAAAAVAGT